MGSELDSYGTHDDEVNALRDKLKASENRVKELFNSWQDQVTIKESNRKRREEAESKLSASENTRNILVNESYVMQKKLAVAEEALDRIFQGDGNVEFDEVKEALSKIRGEGA